MRSWQRFLWVHAHSKKPHLRRVQRKGGQHMTKQPRAVKGWASFIEGITNALSKKHGSGRSSLRQAIFLGACRAYITSGKTQRWWLLLAWPNSMLVWRYVFIHPRRNPTDQKGKEMTRCPKCSSCNISGPHYEHMPYGGEQLRFTCIRCGYSATEPTHDNAGTDSISSSWNFNKERYHT